MKQWISEDEANKKIWDELLRAANNNSVCVVLCVYTVSIQIFKGCNFHGLPKSRISTILSLWISCYHTLYFKCITTVL